MLDTLVILDVGHVFGEVKEYTCGHIRCFVYAMCILNLSETNRRGYYKVDFFRPNNNVMAPK